MSKLFRKIKLFLDSCLPGKRSRSDFIIAGMATMPARSETFIAAFKSIIRQVDLLYLYLDGHETVPSIVADDPRVVCLMSRDHPGLHANGKLLGLALEVRPCLYLCVDDDMYYPRRLVSNLRRELAVQNDRAVVGLHGSKLAQPFDRYNNNRTTFQYTRALETTQEVDLIGTGAALFSSRALQFDVRNWAFSNMVDLGLAIEAARRGIPIVSVARKKNSLIALAEAQPDSIFASLILDDTRQTELAHQLLQLRDAKEL